MPRTDFTSYFENQKAGDFCNCNLGVKSGRNYDADIPKSVGFVHIDEEKPRSLRPNMNFPSPDRFTSFIF